MIYLDKDLQKYFNPLHCKAKILLASEGFCFVKKKVPRQWLCLVLSNIEDHVPNPIQ